MERETILEMVGYFASLLVLISFLMSSVVKLRIINLVGSLIFAIYALLIGSYPTAVMNFCLVGVNIYYLLRMAKKSKHYMMLSAEMDGQYFGQFLQFYKQDMEKFFPTFDLQTSRANAAFLVYCDMVAAGVLIGQDLHDGTLEVALDYSTPAYRDCSIGRYLYEQLSRQGYRKLVFCGDLVKHEKYLKKMGFVLENGNYIKDLRDS